MHRYTRPEESIVIKTSVFPPPRVSWRKCVFTRLTLFRRRRRRNAQEFESARARITRLMCYYVLRALSLSLSLSRR